MEGFRGGEQGAGAGDCRSKAASAGKSLCYCHYGFVVCFLLLLLAPYLNLARIKSPHEFGTDFYGREKLVTTFLGARYHIFGDRVFYSTLAGKSNWFEQINSGSLDDYQRSNPLSEEELRSFTGKLNTLNARLASNGTMLLVVISPNKSTIYPERMPREIPILGRTSRLEQFLAYEKKHGECKVLDLREALFAARKDHQAYYSTDTHWNSYGALAASLAIVNVLQTKAPGLKPHPLTDYRHTSGGLTVGNLARLSSIGVKEDFFRLQRVVETPVHEVLLSTNTGALWEVINVCYSIMTYQEDRSLPGLVMLCDSFGEELRPFLSEYFGRCVYLFYPRTFDIAQAFIASKQPDIVILEFTEQNLGNSWLARLLDI